jgi:NAD(P)H-hydrate epimerase
MAALDRRASEEFGIPVAELMENAGKGVAEQAALFLVDELHRDIADAKVFVCCGRGNKGGDGLVAARHLKALGCRVFFELIPPKPGTSYGKESLANLDAALAVGVHGRQLGEDPIPLEKRLASAHLVIDAVLGTGSKGGPKDEAAAMIRAMLGAKRPILAVDLPSGLDCDTGEPNEPCVRAAWTLTMALPKKGLLAPKAKPYVGELKVVDIGFPRALTA